jgi:hypothetical protein
LRLGCGKEKILALGKKVAPTTKGQGGERWASWVAKLAAKPEARIWQRLQKNGRRAVVLGLDLQEQGGRYAGRGYSRDACWGVLHWGLGAVTIKEVLQ